MKNIALIVLCIAVAVLVWFLIKKDENDPSIKPGKIGRVDMEAEEISRAVKSDGLEHTVYKNAEPILKLIEVKVEDKTKVDSFMKVAGITENQLREATSVKSRLEAENIELKRQLNDQETTYVYRDTFLDIAFKPRKEKMLADFSYNFDFNSITYGKRNWIFGREHTYTDMWSVDPRVKIRGYEKLTIKQPEKPISILVKASSLAIPEANLYGVGGKINLRIKRFNANGSYQWFPNQRTWMTVLGAEFDILDIK